MGTKGRDLLIWIYILAILLSIALNLTGYLHYGSIFLDIALATFLPIAWFYFVTLKFASKKSKRLGLDLIMLVPIYTWWAKIFTRRTLAIPETVRKGYEVHFRTDIPEYSLQIYLQLLDKELTKIANMDDMVKALVLWESHIPVPSRFRKLITEQNKKNQAFYTKGGWGIPYPPFVSPHLRKNRRRIHKGAYYISRKGV